MATRPPTIPIYGLFGEETGAKPAGFAHIETIAERSSLHDWEITPHRHHHAIQALIIARGHADVSLDGQVLTLDSPDYIILPALSVHGFRFHPGTLGHVLTVSQDFLARTGGAGDRLRHLLTRGGHGRLPPAAAKRVGMLADAMLMAITGDWQADPALLPAMAEALLRSLPHPAADAEPGDDRRLALFRHLVEVHLREHRPLDFYADSIGCTQRTLTRLCQARLGQSPLAVVHRRLAIEAQRLLRYTNASVAQVAHDLGFADPSYFSRFYLRMWGHRPHSERIQP